MFFLQAIALVVLFPFLLTAGLIALFVPIVLNIPLFAVLFLYFQRSAALRARA